MSFKKVRRTDRLRKNTYCMMLFCGGSSSRWLLFNHSAGCFGLWRYATVVLKGWCHDRPGFKTLGVSFSFGPRFMQSKQLPRLRPQKTEFFLSGWALNFKTSEHQLVFGGSWAGLVGVFAGPPEFAAPRNSFFSRK